MMTPEQIEQIKPFLYIAAIIPALLTLRFAMFMFLPKSFLKKYFSGVKTYKKEALKKKRRTFDD